MRASGTMRASGSCSSGSWRPAVVWQLLAGLMAAAMAAAAAPTPAAALATAACALWPAKLGVAAKDVPQCTKLGPSITLHWGVAGDTITMAVQAAVPKDGLGFLGIGLSEQGSMKGADIALLNATSAAAGAPARWALVDAHAPGFTRPVADAVNDLTLLGIEEAGGVLSAAWKRALAPCDANNLPIPSGIPTFVIWAHAPRFGYHGRTNRGSALVTFVPQPAAPALPAGAAALVGAAPAKVTAEKAAATAAAPPATAQAAAGADDGPLKVLDLVVPVPSLPTDETTYLVRYFKLPDDKKYHIVKYEPITGSPLVHHGVAYSCPAARNADAAALVAKNGANATYDRFKTRMVCEQFYMLLTPNMSTQHVPAGVGLPMGTANSKWVALEMHYNNPDGRAGLKDPGSGIRVYYTDKLRQHDQGLITLNQPVLSIPPNAKGLASNISMCPSTCTQRFKQPLKLLNVFFHMHGVGKSIVSRHFRAGKELPPIGQLRAFDYAYQGATPIAPDTDTLQPGDELSLQCIFDSTGRSNWTRGGPATNDEMCMAWISYYPAQEDMGLCFSFGAQPFAACGTTFPEDELHGAAGPADRAAVLARAKEAGLLVPVPREASSYKPPYKAACTAKPPV